MAHPTLTPLPNSSPKYMRVADLVRKGIAARGLQPGDKIARVADLCREYDISLGTADKVLRVLEREGLIVRTQGSGIFLATPPRREQSGLLGYLGFSGRARQEFGMHLYTGLMLEGAQAAAQKHGRHLMLLDGEEAIPESLRLDGMLVAPNTSLPPATEHVVLLNHRHPFLPCVDADDATGMTEAVHYLVGLGHRRIAYLISGHEPYQSPRLGAYRAALWSHDIEPDPRWVRHLHRVDIYATTFVGAGSAHMRRWLAEDWEQLGCSALFCQNDQTAFGVLEALREAGLQVPGDVSVVGFDGTEAAQYSQPNLTTIEVPLFDLGITAVEMLLRIIEGDRSQVCAVHPTRLKMGASTAAPNSYFSGG